MSAINWQLKVATSERDTRLEQAFSMKGKQLKVASAESDTRLEQAFSIKG